MADSEWGAWENTDVPAVIGSPDEATSGSASPEGGPSGAGTSANGLIRAVVSASGTVDRLDIHPEIGR